jgi:hypothetical protein
MGHRSRRPLCGGPASVLYTTFVLETASGSCGILDLCVAGRPGCSPIGRFSLRWGGGCANPLQAIVSTSRLAVSVVSKCSAQGFAGCNFRHRNSASALTTR